MTRISLTATLSATLAWLGAAIAAEKPLPERVAGRDFPSVFQAWNRADNLGDEDKVTTEARHDLIFHAPDFFGLYWDQNPQGLSTGFTEKSLADGKQRRAELLRRNPNMVILCEIRYRDAHRSFLPKDNDWWMRDEQGKPKVGWEEGGYLLLDFHNPAYQKHVAQRAAAAVRSGVFDGIMLDWWHEDDARVAMLSEIRKAIGEDALILVNANDLESPKSAPYINGHFMECYRTAEPEDWARIESALRWSDTNLREPRINCLETWFAKSRQDLARMRATTTLGLCVSGGYVLFSDPNPLPTPDHLHDWYPFWDADLGKPNAAGKWRPDGSLTRTFSKGHALYNPPGGAPTTITFDEPHRRQSDGRVAKEHTVAPLDGDLFLRIETP